MSEAAPRLRLVTDEFVECIECHAPVSREIAIEKQSTRFGVIHFHPECWPVIEARIAAKKVAEAARNTSTEANEDGDRRAKIIEAKLKLARDLPDWRWCRIGNPDFVARVKSERLRGFAEKWMPERGSALLCGKSGVGKTSSIVALAWRLIDMIDPTNPKVIARQKAVIGAERIWRIDGAGPIGNLVWTQAAEIANARFRAKLGEEPTIIAKSKGAGLLIVDEMSVSAPEEAFIEILDHRYRKQIPTLVSSGLTHTDFESRYGSAVYRRLTDPGLGNLIE